MRLPIFQLDVQAPARPYIFQVLDRRLAKRPAGSGSTAANLGVRSTTKALVNGVVLAVHGQKFLPAWRAAAMTIPRRNEDFLVGKRDGFPSFTAS